MANLLKTMVWENQQRETALTPDSRATLEQMMNYLVNTKMSRFALEDTRHDLIGMARQAELQGQRFADSLGVPPEEFCDGIAKNSPQRSWQEWVATRLIEVVWIFTILTFLWYLLEGGGKVFPVTVHLIIHLAVWLPYVWFVGARFRRKEAFKDIALSRGVPLLLAGMAVYLIGINLIGRVVLFTLPGWVVWVVLGLLLAAVYACRWWYYRQMARQFHWSQV